MRWSPSDVLAVHRAAVLYENQWGLIRKIEFPHANERTIKTLIPRGVSADVEASTLLIESDPAKVANLIYAHIDATKGTKCHLPACLAEYRRPDQAQTPEAPRERPDPTNQQIMKQEAVIREQAATIRDLKAKLNVAYCAESLFQRVADELRATTQPLETVEVTSIPVGNGTDVDLVVLLSDEHADEVITTSGTWGMERYDFGVFRCRLERMRNVLVQYVTQHLPAHRFNRLWVFKLGDSVNGDIHGKGPKNHFHNTLKAAVAVGDTEAQFVQSLVPYFAGGVHVVSVPGNHPRRSVRKDYEGPQDNFDYLVTTQLATRLAHEIAECRVSVFAPDAWTAFVDVRGHIFALNHGDDVKGFAGHPWYGFDRKNNRVQALIARVGMQVNYFCYGHFHRPVEYDTASARALHNGAFPMTDPFALEGLSVGSIPQQNAYVIDDEYGIVLPIPIYLRNEKREVAFLNGEYEPTLGKGLVIDTVTERHTPGHGLHVISL